MIFVSVSDIDKTFISTLRNKNHETTHFKPGHIVGWLY